MNAAEERARAEKNAKREREKHEQDLKNIQEQQIVAFSKHNSMQQESWEQCMAAMQGQMVTVFVQRHVSTTWRVLCTRQHQPISECLRWLLRTGAR